MRLRTKPASASSAAMVSKRLTVGTPFFLFGLLLWPMPVRRAAAPALPSQGPVHLDGVFARLCQPITPEILCHARYRRGRVLPHTRGQHRWAASCPAGGCHAYHYGQIFPAPHPAALDLILILFLSNRPRMGFPIRGLKGREIRSPSKEALPPLEGRAPEASSRARCRSQRRVTAARPASACTPSRTIRREKITPSSVSLKQRCRGVPSKVLAHL